MIEASSLTLSVVGQLPMHMHGTMGSSPEVLSWTSCPSLLVGKLKEELKLTVVGDALKKANTNSTPSPQAPPPAPPPEIITDLAPPTSLPVPLHPGRDDDLGVTGSSPPCTALSEDSSREQGHFENSVLQLQEHEEEHNAEHEEHGSCGEDANEDGGCNMDHADQNHHDDIKLQFHRANTGGGGFLEGLFGCLKPVWNIIGKTYSTDYKLQQQGDSFSCVSIISLGGLAHQLYLYIRVFLGLTALNLTLHLVGNFLEDGVVPGNS